MKKTLIVACALVASSASLALCQDAGPQRPVRPGGNFLAVARTEDGKIDLSKLPEQMPEQRKEAFKKADKDNDGFLSPEEMRDLMPQRPEGRPGMGAAGFGGPTFMGDAFKDGKIELAKLPEQMPQNWKDNFKKADKDNDGFLTFEEMRGVMPQPQNRPDMGPMGGQFGGFGMGPMGNQFGGPAGGFGPGQFGGFGMGPMGGQFGGPAGGFGSGQFGDAFKDGKLDLSKLPEQMSQERKDAYKKADKDNDGFLTFEEMRNMPRPKFRFQDGKKPDFINDDNAIVIDKLTDAIKSCDKNGDGVIDEEEQKEMAKAIQENFGPMFPFFVQSVISNPQAMGQPGMGPMGFGGFQGQRGFNGPQRQFGGQQGRQGQRQRGRRGNN